MSTAPTYEQLAALVVEQAATIESLTATVTALTARVAELERRLARNSRNSSTPPSQDPFDSPPPSPTRRKTGRRAGKQPGTPGTTLRLVEDPDEVIEHEPDACAGCGAALAGAADAGVTRRQVTDIPEVTARVIEHRLHRRRCSCGCITTAAAQGVNAPVAYGPNLRALAVYLVVFQHVPVERAATLIADVTGARCSTGWVSSVIAATAQLLVEVEAFIKTLLTLSHVLHLDETSTSIGGDKWWLHVACTSKLTAYHLDRSRGRSAVNAFGVLPDYAGVAVHDALSVYDAYPTAAHALCGAHLLREITAAAETHPDQGWPNAALDALHGLNNAAHDARSQGRDRIPPQIADPLHHAWRHAVLCGLAAHPRAPGRKQSKTRNLLERLRERDEQVRRFARDLSVPFTNNQAERDLRPTKTQLKISGCHRAETGAQAWLRIRGYISTARKNEVNVLHALRDAINGNPWKPIPAT